MRPEDKTLQIYHGYNCLARNLRIRRELWPMGHWRAEYMFLILHFIRVEFLHSESINSDSGEYTWYTVQTLQ